MIQDFPHIIKIRLVPLIFFCCVLTFQSLCPVGCLSLAETANRAETLLSQDATIFFWCGQSYSYNMRKVWDHQIWIQNYLGFIVSGLHTCCNIWTQGCSRLNGFNRTGIHFNSSMIDDTIEVDNVFFNEDITEATNEWCFSWSSSGYHRSLCWYPTHEEMIALIE